MRNFSSLLPSRSAGRPTDAKRPDAAKSDIAPKPARKRCLNEAAHKLSR